MVHKYIYEVLKPTYEDAAIFSEGLVKVKKYDKWGFTDRKGQMIIDPQSDDVGNFSEGVSPVSINHTLRYINKTGKFAI